MTLTWARARARVTALSRETTSPVSDMNRIRRKAERLGGIVSFEELNEVSGPRFMATDVRTGRKRFATRARYAKNYAIGLSERGALLAASYGLRCGDVPKGSLVLDCGAHYGDLQLWLRTTCSDGLTRYLGFEPDPEARGCLEKNATAWNDLILPYALSDASASRTFYIEPAGANSSLEEPAIPSTVVTASSRDLDSVMEELGLLGEPVGLLKLEAEGHEPEVLLGAQRTLPRIRLIAADLGPERGPEGAVTAPFVINHLLTEGFRVKRAGEDRQSLRFLFENTRPLTGS